MIWLFESFERLNFSGLIEVAPLRPAWKREIVDGTRKWKAATCPERDWQSSAAPDARFFGGIRCADGTDILNFTNGAGPSRTEQNVSYPGRGVLVQFPRPEQQGAVPFSNTRKAPSRALMSSLIA